MYTFTIEYEVADDAGVPRLGHAYYVAGTAKEAVDEFCREHPGADIRELRRAHA